MLGPGIGGFEVVVIALVALIVVGPKELPGLFRRLRLKGSRPACFT